MLPYVGLLKFLKLTLFKVNHKYLYYIQWNERCLVFFTNVVLHNMRESYK